MDMKLNGRTVLITGGSRGIGFACAMGFAAEGCAVHIASRSKESLEAARDKILGGKQAALELGEKRAEIREIISSELLQEIFLK